MMMMMVAVVMPNYASPPQKKNKQVWWCERGGIAALHILLRFVCFLCFFLVLVLLFISDHTISSLSFFFLACFLFWFLVVVARLIAISVYTFFSGCLSVSSCSLLAYILHLVCVEFFSSFFFSLSFCGKILLMVHLHLQPSLCFLFCFLVC